MSVIVDTTWFRRSFAGFEHPSLPEGYWTASSSVTGDGGGDIQQVRVLFQDADMSRTGLMFSMEQLVITDSLQAASPFIVQTFNMDTMGGLVGQFSMVNSLGQGAASIVGAAIITTAALGLWQAFLGSPFAEGEAGISFATDNQVGSLFSVFVQGYIWGPRSILAAGGPQRPAQGLYRN